MKITPAVLHFNAQGTPASSEFDDVYFSNENGLAETEYVFLQGNNLLKRWQQCTNAHFCIGETGFGTGLNFFCTAALFTSFLADNPGHPLQHLYYISTEKYPIEKAQAEAILSRWSQFSRYTRDWLAHYPVAINGVHRRHFGNNITLDVHYNDAATAFNTLSNSEQGLIHAWYLDGFSPSKNKSMWNTNLFEAMARLSAKQATVATFTAAGFVKRGLLEAGFSMTKQKGFGKKRDMLIGAFNRHDASLLLHPLPYFTRYTGTSQTSPKEVTVIGNGLAGALTALKLVQKKVRVSLLWQGDMPADGASGSPIGGFYPQLNAQHNTASRIQLASFLYAQTFYQQLATQVHFEHKWCGALQLGFNENTQNRLHKLIEKQLWPNEVAHALDANQASELANVSIPYPCLYMPSAGWISPQSLVKACIELASNSSLLTLMPNTQLEHYTCLNNGKIKLHTLHKENKKQRTCDALVLATGSGSQALTSATVPLRLTRGQVEMVASDGSLSKLATLLCHKGYLSPALNGFHALGSTYVKNDTSTRVNNDETQQNFAMHKESMKDASWVDELSTIALNKQNYARAAIRCSSPDHLPAVGAMPSESQFKELHALYKALPASHYPVPSVQKNVHVLTALGSRGLTTAPLMAEIVVSEILQRPIPLSSELLDTLAPNRFIVRSLIRRQNMHDATPSV